MISGFYLYISIYKDKTQISQSQNYISYNSPRIIYHNIVPELYNIYLYISISSIFIWRINTESGMLNFIGKYIHFCSLIPLYYYFSHTKCHVPPIFRNNPFWETKPPVWAALLTEDCQGHRPIMSHLIKALRSQMFADKIGVLGSLYSQGRDIGSSRGKFICIKFEAYFRKKKFILWNCLLLFIDFKARVINSNIKVYLSTFA